MDCREHIYGEARQGRATNSSNSEREQKDNKKKAGARAGKKKIQKRVEIQVLFFCKVSPTIWKC